MQVELGGRTLHYPETPDELSLAQWIQFVRDYQPAEMPQEGEEWLWPLKAAAERAYQLAAYFAGVGLTEAKAIFPFFPTMVQAKKFFHEVLVPAEGPWGEYDLPAPGLKPDDGITFGEFIDSKVIVQAGKAAEQNHWEIILQIAAIWLRRQGEVYEEAFVYEGSARRYLMSTLPIGQALRVAAFWEAFNDDCAKRFAIFRPSSIKGGRFTAKHFERWGWINFLKGIAKTKVFDIPSLNMNSIECARRAPAYDVLAFASEEKEFGEAQYLDQQALYHT